MAASTRRIAGRSGGLERAMASPSHEHPTPDTAVPLDRDVSSWRLAQNLDGMAADREHLRLIIETADLFTWQLDPATRLVAVSANAEAVLGFPFPARADEIQALIHPDDVDEVNARFARLHAGAERYEADYRLVAPSGEVVWVQSRGMWVDAGGERRIAGVTQNITPWKRAGDALRASEERLRRAIEIETVGIIFFRPDGAITFANDAFLRMSGYTREDVANGLVRWDMMTPPEWMPQSLHAIEEFLSQGRTTPYEKEYLRKNGSRWWALFAASRLNDDEGVEFVIDITASKRAELERDRLAAIVESSRDAVIGTDLDGEISDWNPAATQLFGYAPAEVVGRPLARLVPPDLRDENDTVFARIRGGREAPPFQTTRLRKDGTPVPVEVQLSPVRDPAGRIVGVATIIRDVTERKRLEQAQEDFMAMVSHDLRSPITALSGQAQLMKRRQRYDEKAVDVILEQARRIARLVSDLQALVSMEAGEIELIRAPMDLVATVREAADRLRATGGAGHPVRIEAPEAGLTGAWDRDRINQVLDNLLGNAAKYAPEESEIVVQVERAGDRARVSVIDHGPGIPAGTLPHLFERFYRAGRDRALPGLGLGLYISRMLVEAHGGRIRARSPHGGGCTIVFTLPLER
jgi:PAS domain S-box-containing protein